MSMEDFQILGDLGKGSFGYVVKVKRKSDGQIYAMKLIKIKNLKQKQKINSLNQIRFLASINHENIVSYYEAFYDQKIESLCIVMEFANQGDLGQLIKIHQKSKTRIKQSLIWKITYEILQGLNKLHQCKIIHRDIKPANIFFHNQMAKIGDLNVSKHLKDPFTVTQTGTPFYASPEVWNQQPYDYKSDIWSLGCIIYETATFKPPFFGETPQKLYKKVLCGDYQPLPSYYSKELSSFIGKLLNINQQQRPTCKELLMQIKKQNLLSHHQNQQQQYKIQLLKTIKFPTNLKELNNKLPKSQYDVIKSQKKCKTIKNINMQNQQKRMINKVKYIPSMKLITFEKNIEDLNDKRKANLTNQKIK